MSIPSSLQRQLEQSLGEPIARSAVLGGGCISQAAVVKSESGTCVFCKWNGSAPEGFFGAEAAGLGALAAANAVAVPEVLHFDDSPDEGPAYIALEFLEPGSSNKRANQRLGEELAKMHMQPAECCGFDSDNFIGSLVQLNPHEESWSEFFFMHRLCVQARLGSESGWFDENFDRLLGKKEPRIRSLLDEDEDPPCLVHGDLWSGNVFWSSAGPALIDPAVYCGSREADLAFTELFGRFDEDFYSAYNSVYPLQKGYEKRKQVLNLYHLMTHSNLFGGHYISSAYSALTRI